MRVLIPVFQCSVNEPAIDCVADLKFPDPQVDLLAVVEPLPSVDSVYVAASAVYTQEIMDAMHDAGQAALDSACDRARSHGMHPSESIAFGYPAGIICDAATEGKCDLIAIGAEPQDLFTRVLGGSVVQNLASGAAQSLLVVRQSWPKHGKISAVFATDHSPYAERCLQKLLSWDPAGFGHIEVVTAYEPVGHESIRAGRTVALSSEEVECLAKRRLSEKTAAVAARIEQVGIPAGSRIEEGDVRHAIRSSMKAFNANLLILGAKGHSMWERAFTGSTAMHEVVAEPYSLLILRA